MLKCKVAALVPVFGRQTESLLLDGLQYLFFFKKKRRKINVYVIHIHVQCVEYLLFKDEAPTALFKDPVRTAQ